MYQFFGDFDASNGQPLHLVPVYNPGGNYAPEQTYQFGGYPHSPPDHIPISCGPEVCKIRLMGKIGIRKVLVTFSGDTNDIHTQSY